MATPNTNGASAPTGEAFDIGFKLRQRLNEAHAQKERTQTKINALSEQLQRMFSRAPKKPKDSANQMDEKIGKLEYTRTSVSLSLSDEKQLLRQIDAIKRSKKSLQDYHHHEVAIQEKKSEISSLRDHLRTVMASIAELESALSKVELARRLGCDTAELQTRIVDCPSDKIGHIIGKNGSSLKQLENRTGVQIDVDKVGSKIHLQGSISALDAAVREVENITLAIEEELNLTEGIIGYLIAKKSAILNKLQGSHPFVHFDVSRNSTVLRLRGKPDYVAMAKVDINTLDVKTVTRNLLSKETGLIVGKGGATITKLVDEYNVSINVNDGEGGALLDITGPHSQVDSAMDTIESILHDNEELEDYIFVEPMQRNMFLSNGGAALKAIQKEIGQYMTKTGNGGGVLLLFERKDGDDKHNKSEPSKLLIKCSRANIDGAKDIILRKIQEYEATVSTITVDPSMISAIIGKGGAKIKSLRKEGVEIEVAKETGVIKIQSEDDEAKATVISAIEKIVAENQVMTVPVEQSMIGAMFGDIGKSMKKTITEKLGVWMGVDASDENIILRGTVEKINESAELLREFIKQNFTAEFDVPPEDVLMLLGGSQSYLSKLGSTHNVKANIRRGRQVVVVRGEQENVQNAIADLKKFVFGGDGIMVTKFRVEESSLGLIIGKGGTHITKLERDFEGVSLDVHRSSNHLSFRGPEEQVKKCRAHIISLLATSKVTESITITTDQHDMLVSKPAIMKKISSGIDAQINLSEKLIKIRGVSANVKDVKARILEQFTGKFETSVDLETQQFALVNKAAKDPSHFDRIRENTGTELSLDSSASSIVISGKRANVKKAKNQLFVLLEFLIPDELVRVKVSKPVFKAISKPTLLARISADTGANLALDRELNSVLIRSVNAEAVRQAKELLEVKILESEKLNIVIRFDSIDAWLIPKIIGKDGATVREMETETGCKIDVSKAEGTVAIQGESEEIASKGKAALDKVIYQARKENVFISIPDSAMSAFIGKGGENIKKLAAKNNVKIERLKKDPSTILIHGVETSVEAAAAAVSKWLANWELSNEGIKMTVEEAFIPSIMGKSGAVINTIQRETHTKIDLNRRDGTVTIRGGDESSRNLAIDKINDIIQLEKDKLISRQNEIGMLAEKMEATQVNVTPDESTEESPVNTDYHKPRDRTMEFPTKAVGASGDVVIVKKQATSKTNAKKSNGASKKVAPQASQASQSLFNMLVSDNVRDCDSSTISSAAASFSDVGHEEDSATAPVQKAKVYKSASGFTVRV